MKAFIALFSQDADRRPALFLGLLGSVLLLAASCRGSGKPDEAAEDPLNTSTAEITRLSERILAEPSNAGLYYLRGLEFRSFNNQAALTDFKQAWLLDSANANHALGLSEQYFLMNDSRASMGVLNRWLKHNPTEQRVLWALARQALLLKQYELSLGALNQILREDLQNPEVYYLKGRNFRFLGDTAQAISSYQTALEMEPAYERAHLELGVMLLAKGDDTGLRYLRNALALNDSSAAARYQLAKYHQDRGEFTDAVETYEALILRDPQNGAALYNLGTIWYAADSLEKALRLFDMSTKVEPTRAMAYYGKALCAAQLNRSEQAMSFVRQALNLNPDLAVAKALSDSLEALSP
ncbi:MAG: tetratricopeptide repeat protein [Bacteroidetes bacterium]|nr:tetratricopeptide repeat protein [Bacteroidota bacterium]